MSTVTSTPEKLARIHPGTPPVLAGLERLSDFEEHSSCAGRHGTRRSLELAINSATKREAIGVARRRLLASIHTNRYN